ncbi:MAG: tetratricopeptide repeat protein, partial [Alphaproteobacteria bacterium]
LGGVLRAGAAGLRGMRERSVERHHDQADRWRDDGRKLLWSEELDGASRLLSKAAERHPDDCETALALADLHRARGEAETARRALAAARARIGPEPRILSATARLALERGNAGVAADALREATTVAPASPRLLREFAEALAAEGRLDDAVDAATRRLSSERDPGRREEARRELVALRYRAAAALGETPSAADAMRRILAEDPDCVAATVGLAAAAVAAKDPRTAEKALRDGIRRNPRGILLERWRSLLSGDGQFQRAIPLLRDACSGNHLAAPRLALARALVSAGKPDEAEALLAEVEGHATALAAEGIDASPERDFVAAEIALARGREGTAARLFEQAASGPHRPFGYACESCGRASGTWSDLCACGAVGSLDWLV